MAVSCVKEPLRVMASLCVSAEEWSLSTTAAVDLEAKGLRFRHLCILRLSSRAQI